MSKPIRIIKAGATTNARTLVGTWDQLADLQKAIKAVLDNQSRTTSAEFIVLGATSSNESPFYVRGHDPE